MVSIPTDKLGELIDGTDYDMDWAVEQYKEVVEKFERAGMEKDVDTMVSTVSGRMQRKVRMAPEGEFKEMAILGIGHGGARSWSSGDLVIAYGVVSPAEGEREGLQEDGIAAFQIQDEHIEQQEVMQKFAWQDNSLPTLRGWFNLEKADEFKDRQQTYYVGRSTEKSKLEVVNPDELTGSSDICAKLPTDKESQRELLHRPIFFPNRATNADIVNHLSEEFTYYNDKGEEQSSFVNILGLDLKRFEGHVQDVARRLPHECQGDENPYGKITLTDETLTANEVEESLVTDDDARVAGLNVWLPPQLVTFGVDSRVEVYGSITSNEGQISMNGVGVVPLTAFPYELGDEEYEGDTEAI